MAASAGGDGRSAAHSAPPVPSRKRARRSAEGIPRYLMAVAGTLGGISAVCCLQPLDVIKTRLQLDRSASYRGMVHCGATVMRTEGVRALWKGLTPYVAHVPVRYAFGLGCHALLRSASKHSSVMRYSDVRTVTSIGSCVFDALLSVPFEVVKTRLQQQTGLNRKLLVYKGPIHCAKAIIREESLLGLWAGGAPTVMRNITYRLSIFAGENACNVILWNKHHKDGKVLHPWQSFISGFFGYAVGVICTGPFDVVMARLMVQSRLVGYPKYKGMIHAIRTIYIEEGLHALWKGSLPRIIRFPPWHILSSIVIHHAIELYQRNNLRIHLTFPK